jgi:hypothetical protein
MVAGTLAESGYYIGDTMLAATDANPKGYFESREVEQVNEYLIRTMLEPTRREKLLSWFHSILAQPNFGDLPEWSRAHWLAILPVSREPRPSFAKLDLVKSLTARAPFCFKDPRFCYTLPAWRPYLRDTVYICVFRQPDITASSILKEVGREEYLRGLVYPYEQALAMWAAVYRHILYKHRHQGQWLFLHYDQVLTPSGLDRIEALTGAVVNRAFPDQNLARSTGQDRAIPHAVQSIYRELCNLAGYQP